MMMVFKTLEKEMSKAILYNKICKEFDLRVVITSTWRTNHTIELQQIFTEQGIEVPIYDYYSILKKIGD
jgi:hypothetical protein